MKNCLLGHHLVFVGDSTMRQLYWAALQRLDTSIGTKALKDFSHLQNQHVHLSSTANGVHVDFIWDPWLNTTSQLGQLAYFRYRPDILVNEDKTKKENKQSPSIIVLGSPGLWSARNGKEEFLQAFGEGINTVLPWLRANIDDMTQLSAQSAQSTFGELLRTTSDDLSNSVFLVPVLTPHWERLSYGRQMTLTPERINMMNWSLKNSDAIDQSYILWGFEAMAHGRPDIHMDDGIHVAGYIADQRLTNILNARCNAGLPVQGASSQVTCCTPYPYPSHVQQLLLMSAVMGMPWIALHPGSASDRLLRGIKAAACMLVTAAACYIADRTHLLSKQEKDFNPEGFVLSMLAFGILCPFSVCKKQPEPKGKGVDDSGMFLSRTQSDEWRGWMQAFALLYSFHGASQSPTWSKLFRLFTSAFIFLSCYGHTRYFLQTKDFSLNRVVHVLVRLNLLSIILVYMMDRQWTMYYFCPLTSFWFLVIYMTLSTWAHINTNTAAVLFKMAIAAVTTTLLINIRGVLGGVLLALDRGLGVEWDLERVHLLLAMDQLVPYFGMATALVAHVVSSRKISSSDKPVHFEAAPDRLIWNVFHPEEDSVPFKTMALIFSGAALAVFCLVTFVAPVSNEAYDSYHPFISPWFVLAAIIMRNCHSTLRSTHFTSAVALGRISLETSLLHHHIWLAGDSTTILRLASARFLDLPWFGPLLENSQTTILLVVLFWASVKCRSATQQVTDLLTARAEDKGKGVACDA